jgi:hypothetical protein
MEMVECWNMVQVESIVLYDRSNIWKYHKETPYIAILNKQKCFFSKMENRKVKQVLFGG